MIIETLARTTFKLVSINYFFKFVNFILQLLKLPFDWFLNVAEPSFKLIVIVYRTYSTNIVYFLLNLVNSSFYSLESLSKRSTLFIDDWVLFLHFILQLMHQSHQIVDLFLRISGDRILRSNEILTLRLFLFFLVIWVKFLCYVVFNPSPLEACESLKIFLRKIGERRLCGPCYP